MCVPILYQQKMEEFHNALTDVITQKHCYTWLNHDVDEEILFPELLLFEETVCGDVYDDELEELLAYVIEKGHRIVMNFYAPDVVLGNVAVKINDRWFAIGECVNQNARENQWGGQYVTEIWPLKHILPKLGQMEVKLRHIIPIPPTEEKALGLGKEARQNHMR